VSNNDAKPITRRWLLESTLFSASSEDTCVYNADARYRGYSGDETAEVLVQFHPEAGPVVTVSGDEGEWKLPEYMTPKTRGRLRALFAAIGLPLER
jgi:hypothetical protein